MSTLHDEKKLKDAVKNILDDFEHHSVITVETKESGESFMRRSIEDNLKEYADHILSTYKKELGEELRGHIFSRIDFAQYHGKHNKPDADEREKFAKEETEKILSLLSPKE